MKSNHKTAKKYYSYTRRFMKTKNFEQFDYIYETIKKENEFYFIHIFIHFYEKNLLNEKYQFIEFDEFLFKKKLFYSKS
jgi:hypothetical protein